MKPFNLNEYIANPSRKVVTREGRNVRIICTDAKRDCPILALLTAYDGSEVIYEYTKNGVITDDGECNLDLFFDTVKKDGWINLFRHEYGPEAGVIFDTEEDASKNSDYGKNPRFIATIHIEWEELE